MDNLIDLIRSDQKFLRILTYFEVWISGVFLLRRTYEETGEKSLEIGENRKKIHIYFICEILIARMSNIK